MKTLLKITWYFWKSSLTGKPEYRFVSKEIIHKGKTTLLMWGIITDDGFNDLFD